MQVSGTGEAFLAVISAVLVLQPNRDATLQSAAERLMGAAVGTLVGLAAMAVAGRGNSLVPLAGAMLVMGAVIAWKPHLRYGVVAAAGLAVGADNGFLETAQARGIAIFVGALAGIAVGWAVLPESAAQRASRHFGQALRYCRELLEKSLVQALDDEEAELRELHRGFGRSMDRTREAIGPLRLLSGDKRRLWREAVHGADRLWHALIILDRVTEASSDGGLQPRRQLQEQIADIRRRGCGALEHLARLEPPPRESLDVLRTACARARREASSAREDELVTAALVFGLSEVASNIDEIDRAVSSLSRKGRGA